MHRVGFDKNRLYALCAFSKRVVKELKIAFLLAKSTQYTLYFGVALLFLRQFLSLLSPSSSGTERLILRLTEPFFWCADCFCRMLGWSPEKQGIDARYPMAIGILSLAALAVAGGMLGGNTW